MTANHLPLTGVCIVKDACPFGYSMISECFNDQSADANLWRETSSHQSSRRLTVATRKRFLCYSRSNSQANEVSDVLVSLRIDANTAPPPSGFTTLSLTQDTGESSLNEQLLSIKLVPKGLAENFITDIVVVAITKKAPPGYYAVGELNDRLICCQSGNAQKQTVASPFLFRTQSKRFSRSFRSATSLFRLHGVSKPSQRIRFVLWYRHTGDPEIVTIPVHIPASLCKSFQDESEITKDAGDHDITHMAIKNGNIPFMYLVAPKLIQLKVPNIVNSSQLERLQSLMHLKTLDLSNNDFSSGLPIVISELISLRDLCLSNCELNAFPKSLAKTTLLETLDLSDNKLLSISSHVHQLSTLKLLNLSANVDLVWIDDHIMQLKNLAKLECNGCESLETPPYAVCQQGLHAVRQYFTDLAKHHARLLTSAPLVVIGQALAGKTSIVRSLQAGKRQLTYRSDSSPLDEGTKVFQVEELHLQNHALNVIDYGGHEPYLHTYSLLIGEQCMPLIVVNIEEYFHLSESKGPKEAARRVLFDWISQAYLVSPHLGPPLLALTHLDRYTDEQCKFSKRALLENTELLRSEMLEEESNYVADFPNQLNHILHLSNQSIPIFSPEDIFEFNNSLHETGNIENLKDNLNRRCEKLICVVPQMWNAVHSFMELQCDRPFIALADIISEFSNDDVSFILRWLRNTGRILWFEEIPALAELVFHDLTAITELIATIFHHCSNELWEQRLETFTCFRHKQSVISKPQYEMLVEQFRRTGLMEEALLFNLLKTHSKFPTHVAIELLKGLYILYGPIDQSRISSYVIPAFSSNFMDSAWMTDGYLQLRLDLRFSGFSPPKHLYQIATVEFLNTSFNQLSTIMATRNGATIYDGEITKHLVHDYNNSKMTLQVSSTVEKLAPSWNRLQAMVRVIRNLIGRLWKGCYTVVQMYCSHCLFMRESDPDFYIDPEWLNDDLGSPKEFSNVQFISCKHSGRQKATNSSATVPKALRWPCSKIDDAEIEKLRNYLSSLEHQRCSPSFALPDEDGYTYDVDVSSSDVDSDLSDVEEKGYCDSSSDVLMSMKVKPVHSYHIKQLYNNTDEVYPMSGGVRGRVLIFNMRRVSHERREGSEVDYHNISQLFKTLGFDIVKSEMELTDLTAEEIFNEIEEETQRQEHHTLGMFVLVIMSHGGSGNRFYDCDGQSVHLVSVQDLLSPHRFPAMKGKPKLVIVQACFGGRADYGDASHATSSARNIYKPELPATRPSTTSQLTFRSSTEPSPVPIPPTALNVDDFFIMKAASESYLATRSHSHGSWFIRVLVATFYRHACHRDVESLFKIIQARVRQVSISHMSSKTSYRIGGNVPTSVCTFTNYRKLFLFPRYSHIRR